MVVPRLALTLLLAIPLASCERASPPTSPTPVPKAAADAPGAHPFIGRWEVDIGSAVDRTGIPGLGKSVQSLGIPLHSMTIVDIRKDGTGFVSMAGMGYDCVWTATDDLLQLTGKGMSGDPIRLRKTASAVTYEAARKGATPEPLKPLARGREITTADVTGTWSFSKDASVEATLAVFKAAGVAQPPTKADVERELDTTLASRRPTMLFNAGACSISDVERSEWKLAFVLRDDVVICQPTDPDNARALGKETRMFFPVQNGTISWRAPNGVLVFVRDK